jgi:hypothetical protein
MRRTPSAATVLALIALFAAVGGASALANAKAGAKAVIARLSNSGPVEVPGGGQSVPIPFTTSSWTQGATELNGIGGSATVTAPSTACSSQLVVILESAGREVGLAYALDDTAPGPENLSPGETRTVALHTFDGPWPFPEPGTSATNTLTAKADGACAEGHWTLDALHVSVVGVR